MALHLYILNPIYSRMLYAKFGLILKINPIIFTISPLSPLSLGGGRGPLFVQI